MPLTASGELLVDAGVRLMDSRQRQMWAQWRTTHGWALDRRNIDDPPEQIVSLAEQALDLLRLKLEEAIQTGDLSDIELMHADSDLDRVEVTLQRLRSARNTNAPSPR